MRFIDPFVLLQLHVSDPKQVTDAMLQAAQAKLDAAIKACRTPEMPIAGKTIFKADAEALSAAMNDTVARQRFWEMRLVGGMIAFLENGVARDLQPLLARSVATGPEFHAFASRWIARAIDWQMYNALRSSKWVDGVQLARGMAGLHPLSEQAATTSARTFFKDLAQNLMQRSQNPQEQLREADFKPFCLSAMLGVLNNLPASMQDLRDSYATGLGAAAAYSAVVHRDQPWTYAIAQSASQIKVSAAVQSQMRGFLQRVKEDSGIAAHEARMERNKRLAAFGSSVMLIIIVILRIIFVLMH